LSAVPADAAPAKRLIAAITGAAKGVRLPQVLQPMTAIETHPCCPTQHTDPEPAAYPPFYALLRNVNPPSHCHGRIQLLKAL